MDNLAKSSKLKQFIQLSLILHRNTQLCNQLNFTKRQLNNTSWKDPYAKFWKILGIPDESDSEQVRQAYLELSKRFHPDSSSPEADLTKFQAIDEAYRKLQEKFANERHRSNEMEGEFGLYYDIKRKRSNSSSRYSVSSEEDDDAESPDIKHTAPQHRQYLSYEGLGTGSISQREKQYGLQKALRASQNVYEHRVSKCLEETSRHQQETALAVNVRQSKKIKTGLGIERLVEDMIQESMAKGDFANLSGSGKPLPNREHLNQNPYIDFTTHKLNQVLIENGFVPEWILLEKEIRDELGTLRSILSRKRHSFGEVLKNSCEQAKWKEFLESNEIRTLVKNINQKIDKYNFLVPSIRKQLIKIRVDIEGRKALEKFSEEIYQNVSLESKNKSNRPPLQNTTNSEVSSGGFLDAVFSVFFKN